MLGLRALTAMLVALGVFLAGSTAWAQFPGRTPGSALFPELPVRGPIVVYPTLTLGVEYNDNVFLTNDRKRSDYIGSVTPGPASTASGYIPLSGVIVDENDVLRIGIALVSAAIIATAVYISKRRPVAIGEEIPAELTV